MIQETSSGHQNKAVNRLAASGPLAGIIFFASLIGFGLLRTDGFTHGTKAVSELGVKGAPNAMAFNLLAFILPGLLCMALAWSLHRASGRQKIGIGIALLLLSGLSLALSGIFAADMDNLSSPSSILHFTGAILCGLFWTISIFWLRPVLRDAGVSDALVRLTPYFVVFVLAHFAVQIIFQTTGLINPGWGQRIGFLGLFIWYGWTGLSIQSRVRTH